MEENRYNIKLDMFEGPFDLLLTLLEKNKLEIMDIQISVIADQYVDFLFSEDVFNMDIATEFLVMAMNLIHMKSRKLLPQPEKEEEEMTEEELKERLVRYKRFKEVAPLLAEQMEKWSGATYFTGEALNFTPREEAIELNPQELLGTYTKAYARYTESRNDNTEKMQHILKIEKVSLTEKIRQVITSVKRKAKVIFSEIFNTKKNTKLEVVTGFLAVLELNKCKKVDVKQEKLFSEIEIKYRDDNEDNMILTGMEEEYD
ncbi:MAG: chromosome segregation protein ScpA [Ruminococcaceae bacterium]|nr:chromosome segregation protein ScpA [Oscillospiraceae bacterium]